MGTQCYVFFTQFFEDGGGSILLIIHVLDMVLVSLSRARGKSTVELISNTNWTNSFWSGCESESVFQLTYIYFFAVDLANFYCMDVCISKQSSLTHFAGRFVPKGRMNMNFSIFTSEMTLYCSTEAQSVICRHYLHALNVT